jgi:hypothetical protein
VGGGQSLGSIDGGQRTPLVRQQQEACLLRLCLHGRALGWPQVLKEKGRGRAQAGTSRWGPGVRPGRWLDADWGCRVERVRERGGQDLGQDLPWGFPLPSVHPHGTKRIRGRESNAIRGRGVVS